MAFLSSIDIIGSGITAQHLRLDIISENITNMNTTRTEAGGPYRRKVTVFQAESGKDTFRNELAAAQGRAAAASNRQAAASRSRVVLRRLFMSWPPPFGCGDRVPRRADQR